MGLLRTPPQRVNRSSQSPQPPVQPEVPVETSIADATMGDLTVAQTVGDVTMHPRESVASTSSFPSPAKAFQPRNPGVMRSPVSQPSTLPSSSVYPALPASLPPPPEPVTSNEEVSMEIDEPSVGVDTSSSMEISTPSRVNSISANSKTPIRRQEADQTFQADSEVNISLPSLAPITPVQPSRIVEEEVESPIPPPPTTPGPTRAKTPQHRQSTVTEAGYEPESFRADTTVNVNDSVASSANDTEASIAYTTPKNPRVPKTPRSTRKTPAEVSKVLDRPAEPIADIPISRDVVDEKEEDYGRRWKTTTETLVLVARRIVEKWTIQDLKNSLPILAKKDPVGLEQIYRSSSQALQEGILAYEEFDKRQVRTSLQLLDQITAEAEKYEMNRTSDRARPDAWRSDLTPAALTAANILPVYDRAWQDLREEYMELHEDARRRYISILSKQAQLKELEGSVSDGVVELEKTIKLLDGFPNEDMMAWMEDVAGKAGAREP